MKKFLLLFILASLPLSVTPAFAKKELVNITPVEKITTANDKVMEGDYVNFKIVNTDKILRGLVVKYEPNGMLGKEAIASTANIPLASIPQGAIAGAYSNSTTTKNFTIGDITIQTQATDAEGIANDLLQNIKMAFNGLDTGVRA